MEIGKRTMWVLVCLAFLWAGCAGDQQLKKQVSDLQAQITETQATLADMNLRMEEMNSSLFVLRETTKNNREAIKKLQEQADTPTVYINQPQERVAMDTPPSVMNNNTAAESPLAPMPLPAGGSGGPVGNDEQAFRAAVGQMEKQNWGLAIYDLNAFIAQHPNSAYLPRARFALGESFRQLGELGQAVREYERCVAAGKTAGPYAARSLFWLAQSYQQLGQTEKAGQAKQRLLQEYPDSPEAKKINLESPR
ncbi:MAG: tetratricopeptide repeat protein [Myxococcales bacterium]|nr:tetratricopeptide repeat protein [Myxococcales bacterium]